jgi:hypothetical protein
MTRIRVSGGKSNDDASGASVVLPPLELKGSTEEKLKAIDAEMRRLEQLRRSVAGDVSKNILSQELYGPYLNAPVWPWFAAGWVLGALFVLLFVVAWSFS